MIHESALIYKNVIMGKNVDIHEFVTLGSHPYIYERLKPFVLPRWTLVIAKLGVIIGDDVKIHSYSRIERGVLKDTIIKDRVKIASRVTVGHDSTIEEGCMLHPSAEIWGNVHVGRGTYIGGCACIKQGLKIGKDCVIGMNSTVTHDIPDNSLVYNTTKNGEPVYARVIKNTRNKLKSLIRRNLI